VYPAVGFDLDDTLAVTTRPRDRLLAEACERVDAPRFSRTAYLDAHDAHSGVETREPVFAALLAGRSTDATAADLAAAYRETVEAALEPVSGAERTVRALAADRRVGLLTDGPVAAQRSKLETLGWTDLFDAVVVTGRLDGPKPDRRAFAALCDALDAAPAATAYVGDHPERDVAGAADAGLAAVQVAYEGGPEPEPRADAVVRRDALAGELPAALDGLTPRS